MKRQQRKFGNTSRFCFDDGGNMKETVDKSEKYRCVCVKGGDNAIKWVKILLFVGLFVISDIKFSHVYH